MNTNEAKSRGLQFAQKLLNCKYRNSLEWLVAPAVVLAGLIYLAWKYPVTSGMMVLIMAIAGIESTIR